MSICSGRISAATIDKNYADLHPLLNALQAEQEAARCLFCFDAPCTEACPSDIDVPGFIRKITSGNLQGAATTILSENIMGNTCGNVCPVEELCEQVCVKNTSEEKPVVIGQLQRYATNFLLETGYQPFERAAQSGKSIAVVGAGPAGLACAHRLALHGHTVTIYEAMEKAGGLNEYGLAAYKMNNNSAAREIDFILSIGGIEIKYNQALGRDFSLQELTDQYAAVYLGLGHNGVNSLGLENETAVGVHNAVDFIQRIRQEDKNQLPVGRNIVVIGGGNTAIDIAVQMKKLGAASVTLAYRRNADAMGATDYEQAVAQTNGVTLLLNAKPTRIITIDNVLQAVEFASTATDEDGKLIETGETFKLPADQLFKAIGQQFNPRLIDLQEIESTASGRIHTNALQSTSLAGVWAGGDCTPGDDLTVVAVQDGKLAAEEINTYLKVQS